MRECRSGVRNILETLAVSLVPEIMKCPPKPNQNKNHSDRAILKRAQEPARRVPSGRTGTVSATE